VPDSVNAVLVPEIVQLLIEEELDPEFDREIPMGSYESSQSVMSVLLTANFALFAMIPLPQFSMVQESMDIAVEL